jgi:hypothetical protein
MANFVLLYSGGGGMAQTQAEQAAQLQVWTAWFGKLGSAVVDGGNPFTPAAKHIASNGAVSDLAGGMMASGYSILKADSLAAAVEMAKGCPVLQGGGQVAVFETFNAM